MVAVAQEAEQLLAGSLVLGLHSTLLKVSLGTSTANTLSGV